MRVNLNKEIQYGAELTRTRFWQEAYLAAQSALIASNPVPYGVAGEASDIEQYARDIARASFVVADEALKQHGPSVSGHLQGESPFVAARGVRNTDDDDSNGEG